MSETKDTKDTGEKSFLEVRQAERRATQARFRKALVVKLGRTTTCDGHIVRCGPSAYDLQPFFKAPLWRLIAVDEKGRRDLVATEAELPLFLNYCAGLPGSERRFEGAEEGHYFTRNARHAGLCSLLGTTYLPLASRHCVWR